MNSQVDSSTNGWQIGDVFYGALQTLVNDRCRRAYIHDMRGGLQAIYSSFELLVRCAKQGSVSEALIDNAAALAKRAMASHERIVLEMVSQLTVVEGESVVVNVLNMIDEVQRFLRNDASSRNIHIAVTGGSDVEVSASLFQLRTLLLGLLSLWLDELPEDAELQIDVGRVREDACVSFQSRLSFGEIRSAEAILRDQETLVQPRDLILGGARYWLQKNGGRMVAHAGATLHNDLQIYYPLYKVSQ